MLVNVVDKDKRFGVRDEQGFAVYVLANERVEVSVVPELGARIISLKSLGSAGCRVSSQRTSRLN